MNNQIHKKIILEIRAGTGGDEAAIFAGDLARMYQRYAAKRGWRFARGQKFSPSNSSNFCLLAEKVGWAGQKDKIMINNDKFKFPWDGLKDAKSRSLTNK